MQKTQAALLDITQAKENLIELILKHTNNNSVATREALAEIERSTSKIIDKLVSVNTYDMR